MVTTNISILFQILKCYLVLVNGDDFKAGVVKLAKMLNVVNHPDHLVTLRAISKLVRSRLNPEALAKPESVVVKVILLLIVVSPERFGILYTGLSRFFISL
jgi:hypothetical protein